MIRAAYLILALLLAGTSCTAADNRADAGHPVTVTAGVDSPSVGIGDRITYTIRVKSPKGYEVRMPSFGENLAGFSVKDFTSDEGGFFSRTYTQSYTLDIYETGTFTIPASVITYKESGSSEWKEEATQEVSVTVQSRLSETGKPGAIREIKGPHSISNFTYLYIGIALILIIAAAAALFIYLKNRKQASAAAGPPPSAAHETALRALKALMSKDYIKTGKIQEHYFELSNIVRHYLEDRFLLKAPEMTTEEFLLHLKQTEKLNTGQKSLLREFLSHCDMVKFARHLPAGPEITSSYEAAERLVEQTKEVPSAGGKAG